MSRKKGNRNRRRCKEYFEEKGYLVDIVEQTGRFIKNKDLFSAVCDGFDLIAIKPNEIVLIQVKSNKPAVQRTYKEFAKEYASDFLKVLCATWYDRDGWRLQWYNPDETITEEDLR